MPLPDALRIASEIADALEFARQRGIVHRDLKPANVMLTGDGHAKVMDFGIAKYVSIPSADGGRSDGPSMTSTGEITGTPAYMAPEQLKGLPLDSRADIFALGVCLYEMVTGTHPFMKDSGFATADAILNQPAPPLDRYLKDPPEGLEHVFRRALAKEPDQRYQSFKDLRIDLGVVDLPQTRTAIAPPVRTRARPRVAGARAHHARRRRWRGPGLADVAGAAQHLAAGARVQRTRLDSDYRFRELDGRTRVRSIVAGCARCGDCAIPVCQRLSAEPGAGNPPAHEEGARPTRSTSRWRPRLPCASTSRRFSRAASPAVGDSYTLTAQVIDPQSRVAVQTESTQARGKDAVLPALDELATRVRRNLGESLNSVSTQKVALPRATTASLEALRLYAESLRTDDSDVRLEHVAAGD